MKKLVLAVLVVMLAVTFAFAAPKTYQWTGEVTEVKRRHGIREKRQGDLADRARQGHQDHRRPEVGSKVTVEYTMKAVKIEGKATRKLKRRTQSRQKRRNNPAIPKRAGSSAKPPPPFSSGRF